MSAKKTMKLIEYSGYINERLDGIDFPQKGDFNSGLRELVKLQEQFLAEKNRMIETKNALDKKYKEMEKMTKEAKEAVKKDNRHKKAEEKAAKKILKASASQTVKEADVSKKAKTPKEKPAKENA
ncbi:MAG: hypothetical protein A2Y33_07120 [Spirochaetes bacterium GWF1_51_8]|nr:MAG: hypothetical protein A2Y33_07120 [Spirochaetes bacterium GWF1_51_8]